MKYYRKVNFVEAIPWTGCNPAQVKEFAKEQPVKFENDDVILFTPNGSVSAHRGDWICRDAMGFLYPCSDTIFRRTYYVGDGAFDMCIET